MQPKVLVPLDGQPAAERALPMARLVAGILDAELDVFVVVRDHAPDSAVTRARAYLDATAVTLGNPVGLSTRVLRGNPGEGIVREAAAEDVSMVVMATHARSGLLRAALGSVAEQVVAHAPAPTLLVPPGAHPRDGLTRMLVAIDSSGVAPLARLVGLARAARAQVVLTRVIQPRDLCVWQWQSGPVLRAPQAVIVARMQLDDLVSRLRTIGIDAQARVIMGSPVSSINSLAEAADADLIILATHARTGPQRTLQGSVTDAVLRTSGRPVLTCRLIPPSPDARREIELLEALRRIAPKPPRLPILGAGVPWPSAHFDPLGLDGGHVRTRGLAGRGGAYLAHGWPALPRLPHPPHPPRLPRG